MKKGKTTGKTNRKTTSKTNRKTTSKANRKTTGKTNRIRWHENASTWKIVSIILIVVLLLVLFPRGDQEKEQIELSKDVVQARITKFLQSNLGPDATVTVHSVVDQGNVYAYDITVQNERATVYATKDGKFLFPGAIDMTQDIPVSPSPTGSEERVEVSVDDDPSMGDADAPVTIVEFGDFQCPYCGRFTLDALKKVEEAYVDTGKVRLVFRDFPLSFHPEAQKAAEAAECADDQGKFWEYHDELFANQNKLSTAFYSATATKLDLDVAAFTECLNSDKYADEVKADIADGVAAGVRGTPSIFINGLMMSGAVPFSEIESVIDRELGVS